MNEVEFYLEDLKSKFSKIDPNKYSLCYSGGKDSHFLYWFIKEYAHIEGIEVVGVNTYMEHPQIRKRMYDNCDVVLLPSMKPFEIKEKFGSPCFSKLQDEFIRRYQNGSRSDNTMKFILGKENTRFKLNKKAREYVLSDEAHKISSECCKYLKKKPMAEYGKKSGRKFILGVRGSEGRTRKFKYTSCFKKDGTFTPLWDLTDELLDKIYETYNIEIPEIYNHISRTGCMGCPYGSFKGNTQKELALLNDNQKKFVCEYFKESYKVLGIDWSDNN